RLGRGWTFAYDEQPFDRVIRLCDPVQFRSALVDPWEDTTVTRVEASRSLALRGVPLVDQPFSVEPLLPVFTDQFVGQPVSLGNAKFNARGGGVGPERGRGSFCDY